MQRVRTRRESFSTFMVSLRGVDSVVMMDTSFAHWGRAGNGSGVGGTQVTCLEFLGGGRPLFGGELAKAGAQTRRFLLIAYASPRNDKGLRGASSGDSSDYAWVRVATHLVEITGAANFQATSAIKNHL